MERRYLFIVNPISGGGKNQDFAQRLLTFKEADGLVKEVVYTKSAGHGYTLCKDNLNKFDVFVAVGGDGTINEVGKALINTDKVLGIIPTGSGNGLGNFLKIPKRLPASLKVLSEGTVKCIDTGVINEHPFLNVAGIGFDGRISKVFSQSVKRGLPNYIKYVVQEILQYKPQKISIETNKEEISEQVFMVSFANSSQFGNNFKVSQDAQIDDGQLNMTMVKPFSPVEAIPLGVNFAAKALDKAPQTYSSVITQARVVCEHPAEAHVDGEPLSLDNVVDVAIVPQSLNVMVP